MLPLNQSLLDQILPLALRAGEFLRNFYAKSVEVKIKADHTPVTEADLFVSQFLTQELNKLTPEIPVLSEENCQIPLAERQNWQEYWIIDPLDGTQQFINRTDQFSVVIGLVQKNQPVFGIIHSPILDKTYYAIRGQGAFLQQNGTVKQLFQRNNQKLNHPIKVAVGLSGHSKIHTAAQPPYSAELYNYGSSSLKAGLVAEGIADCYIRLGDTGEWDTAVPEVLLAETGGAIFDTTYQPLIYNLRETFINPHFIMVGNNNLDWKKIFVFE